MIQKPEKVTTGKENYKSISLMHSNIKILREKKTQKNLAIQIQWHIRRITYHAQEGIIPRIQGWLNIEKSM